MLEGWGATLPLKPSTHGRGRKGKSWKEGEELEGRGEGSEGSEGYALPCPT